jgi:hypothetical protein
VKPEGHMIAQPNPRTTRESRDSMVYLAQEMRIRNFSPRTIDAYLYYNKELLIFAIIVIENTKKSSYMLTGFFCII